MTNEHEKEWAELVNREISRYCKEVPIGDQTRFSIHNNAVQFVRANLSKLPEVRELVEEIKTLKDTKWFNPIINQWEPTVSVYRANKLIEALKKLEGKK